MTFQRCPTLSPSPEASPGDTWTWFLLADFRTFNPCQYELNYHSNVCWSSQNSTLDQPAITNSMHSQSKYTLTPPPSKHILYFKQLAEDLRNIFTSVGHARKSWTQPASSFPWFTSKTKRWNLGLILNIKFLDCNFANISLSWSNCP